MGRFITVDGINITVIRQLKSKSVRLKIDRKTGLPVISIPYLYPLFMAQKFVQSHLVWLKKQMELTPSKTTFKDKMSLMILGKQVTICHAPGKRFGTRIEDDILYVCCNEQHLHRRVSDYIKDRVRYYAGQKALEFARLSDVRIKSVAVRDTVSRWGSCSSDGHLSFCWRLGLAPLFVLDYVVAHEVAHLREMNHSRAFWKVVKTLYPQTDEAKKWLTRYGKDLHRYN